MEELNIIRRDGKDPKKKRECMNCDNCRAANKKRLLMEKRQMELDKSSEEEGLKELCGGNTEE
jgi:hypothetical protein